MNADNRVERALKALADADATRRAPRLTEQALLDACDRQARRSASRRSLLHGCAMLAVIVLVPLTMSVYRAFSNRGDFRQTAPSAHATIVAAPRTASKQNVAERPATTDVNRPRVAIRARRTAAQHVRKVLPILQPVASADRDAVGQTIQLRVPRSFLARLGVPVIEPDAAGTVTIELMLREDGLARTIRVLQ
jgi:hypothetical protein